MYLLYSNTYILYNIHIEVEHKYRHLGKDGARCLYTIAYYNSLPML